MRAPSSLYSSDASPSSASAAPTSSAESASIGCTGWNGVSANGARPASPSRERGARDRREVARQHGRATDPGRRHAGRARDGIDEHAFERALPQLAEQETEEKVLFGGRGRAISSRRSCERAAADPAPGDGRDAFEQRVHLAQFEVRRFGGWNVAHAGEHRAADLHPALARLAAQKRDHDGHFVRRHAAKKIGQMSDFLQPA